MRRVLLFSFLLFLSLSLAAQSTEATQPPGDTLSNGLVLSTTTSQEFPTLMPPGEEWKQSWLAFRNEYLSFTLNLEQFLDQVEAFGISFEDLPLYLSFLTSSWEASEKALLEERKAAKKALAAHEREIQVWKAATIASLAIAAFGIGYGLSR